MSNSDLKIFDFTPFTLLDYPEHLAAIIWLAGCNMRCPYCHNAEIVFGNNQKSFSEIEVFLQKRVNFLEGIVVSGGEPTIYPHLEELCRRLKYFGYKVKLDTNGSRPEIVASLIEKGLLDYVAVDFKAPNYKFTKITALPVYFKMIETLDLLKFTQVDFEVRTTVHTALLDEKDLEAIYTVLKEKNVEKQWKIQNYIHREISVGNMDQQDRMIDRSMFEELHFIEWRNF